MLVQVMFLCPVARPRLDTETSEMWDGKIGIWPVDQMTQPLHNSVNRVAGTMVWKNESMTQAKYREYIKSTDLAEIKRIWASSKQET